MTDDNLSLANVPQIRTFEAVVYTSVLVEGTLTDWPQQMQDQVYEALERLAHKVQLPLTIVAAYGDLDYGDDGKPDRPYVRIVASEIVARDMRFSSDEAMKKAFDELIKANGGLQ